MRKNELKKLCIHSHISRGRLKLLLNEYKSALNDYDTSLNLALSIKDNSAISEIYLSYFEYFFKTRDMKKSYEYLELAKKINNDDFLNEYYHYLATLKIYEKKYKEGEKYIKLAMSIEKEKFEETPTSTYINLAIIYHHLNDIKNSKRYYFKSASTAKERNELIILGNVYNHIGALFNSLETALEYFNKSLELRRNISDIKGEIFTLNNISTMYLKNNKILEARKTLLKILALTEKLNDIYFFSIFYFNLSKTEIILGNYEYALIYAKKSLFYCDKTNDEYDRAYTNILYGFLKIMLNGNIQENIELFNIAEKTGIENKNNHLLLLLNYYRAYSFFQTGNISKSKKHFKEFMKYYNLYGHQYYREEMIILKSLIYKDDGKIQNEFEKIIYKNEKNQNRFYTAKLKYYFGKYLEYHNPKKAKRVKKEAGELFKKLKLRKWIILTER